MIPGGFRKHNVFIDEIVPLIDDYFMGEQDTLVYEDPEFRTAYIKQYPGGILVTVYFDDVSSFSIWSKPGAEFLCLEPWHGIPEEKGEDPDITKKPGFIRLEEGSVFESAHTIHFG